MQIFSKGKIKTTHVENAISCVKSATHAIEFVARNVKLPRDAHKTKTSQR